MWCNYSSKRQPLDIGFVDRLVVGAWYLATDVRRILSDCFTNDHRSNKDIKEMTSLILFVMLCFVDPTPTVNLHLIFYVQASDCGKCEAMMNNCAVCLKARFPNTRIWAAVFADRKQDFQAVHEQLPMVDSVVLYSELPKPLRIGETGRVGLFDAQDSTITMYNIDNFDRLNCEELLRSTSRYLAKVVH